MNSRNIKLARNCISAAVLSACMASVAQAQLVEDIELRREGPDAVVQIRFEAAVQYLRSTTSRTDDMLQAIYSVMPTQESLRLMPALKTFIGGGGIPTVTIKDEAVMTGSRSDVNRQLIVQLSKPAKFRVRAGKGNRSIEIVFEDLGPEVDVAIANRMGSMMSRVASGARAGGGLAASLPSALSVGPAVAVSQTSRGSSSSTMEKARAQVQAPAAVPTPTPVKSAPDAAIALAQDQATPSVPDPVVSAPAPVVEAAQTTPADALVVAANAQPSPAPIAPTPVPVPAPVPAPVATAAPVGVPQRPIASQSTEVAIAAGEPPNPATSSDAGALAQAAANVAAPVQTAPVEPPMHVEIAGMSAEDAQANGAKLLASAQSKYDAAQWGAAIDDFNQLLSFPNNPSTRKAQELIGMAHRRNGDNDRAKAELEAFVKLYPVGEDAERVKLEIAALPKVETPAVSTAGVGKNGRPRTEPTTEISGSLASTYFGGASNTRSQDFQDSPLGGLPVLMSDSNLSSNDQSIMQHSIDLNWHYHDDDKDRRIVLRDGYTQNLTDTSKDRNRLSALYFEERGIGADNPLSYKVGRQSPNGGGIQYRFDGVSANYKLSKTLKLGAAAGLPSDPLLSTSRNFVSASIDVDQITKNFGAGFYLNEQTIDGQTDRRALGVDMRYFKDSFNVFSQFDYDVVMNTLNVATVQGSYMTAGNTSFNLMYDHRSVPIASLANALFFQDPTKIVQAQNISDLLVQNGGDIGALREGVKATTAYQSQAMAGVSTPINEKWQVGGNINWTNVGAIAPVATILPNGMPSTGDLYSAGAQLVGSNLYSSKDTNVFSVNYMMGPTYKGTMYSYNNMTGIGDKWSVEPSLRYYVQNDTSGGTSERLTPGLRLSYKYNKKVSIDSDFTYEKSRQESTLNKQDSTRYNYSIGMRYDF